MHAHGFFDNCLSGTVSEMIYKKEKQSLQVSELQAFLVLDECRKSAIFISFLDFCHELMIHSWSFDEVVETCSK